MECDWRVVATFHDFARIVVTTMPINAPGESGPRERLAERECLRSGYDGYTTSNIDRTGIEGMRFTDHHAQLSCTAGRAAFITGQYPIRSGMTTVGMLDDGLGLQSASAGLEARPSTLRSRAAVQAGRGEKHEAEDAPPMPSDQRPPETATIAIDRRLRAW
jgi:arylsulfatase A-like enzyme